MKGRGVRKGRSEVCVKDVGTTGGGGGGVQKTTKGVEGKDEAQ